MRFARDLLANVQQAARHYPALILTGARQSGKTTLLRHAFPEHRYVSLDLPSAAQQAEERPADFLRSFPPPVIVDEVQYAPGLFRHLKVAIDADRHRAGQFVLTGSQKFTLMRSVGDSLAGRCAVFELEALSTGELASGGLTLADQLPRLLTRGGFPELWRDEAADAATFFAGYLATYIERDVRQLLNIVSLRDFERFLRLCATYNAQLLNKAQIAQGVGVSVKTVSHWLSVLEACNQVTLLEPYFANVGKRTVKTPKLYFCDSGFVAYLLGLEADHLLHSPFLGALWESFVFAELRKLRQHCAPSASLWFYRDQQGREVDFLWIKGGRATLFECKWNEHPSLHDARAMQEVGTLLGRAKPVGMAAGKHYVVARPPLDFPIDASAEAVHALRLDAALRRADA